MRARHTAFFELFFLLALSKIGRQFQHTHTHTLRRNTTFFSSCLFIVKLISILGLALSIELNFTKINTLKLHVIEFARIFLFSLFYTLPCSYFEIMFVCMFYVFTIFVKQNNLNVSTAVSPYWYWHAYWKCFISKAHNIFMDALKL